LPTTKADDGWGFCSSELSQQSFCPSNNQLGSIHAVVLTQLISLLEFRLAAIELVLQSTGAATISNLATHNHYNY